MMVHFLWLRRWLFAFFRRGSPLTVLRSTQVMFTLYGDYVRHAGGSIWVGSLVQLLAHLGMSEQSVRSTIVRMSRSGWLEVQRINRKSYYSLTPKGKRLLDEGAARIFRHSPSPRDRWDGQWRLVAYSIPESLREKRAVLRRELGYLGFGPLTSALWVSPHDLCIQVSQLAVALDLVPHIEFFTATHNGMMAPGALVRKCWDLDSINGQYAAFIATHQPALDECRANRATLEPADCFLRRFMLIHEYRRFPFADPQLPSELLPADWHGLAAAELFQEYHDLLADKANRFFESVYVGPSIPVEIAS